MVVYICTGFYSEQININKNERARTIQVQGQRPLSTRTRARFDEFYRVPEACDMSNIKTSFVHGLLTIELPMIVSKEKEEQRAQELGKGMQTKSYKEESNKNRADGNVGNKQPQKDQIKASQKRKEVEGDGSRSVKDEKMVEDKSEGSLKSKKHAKEGKAVEDKKFNGGDQGKSEGSLEIKKRAKEDKVIEDKNLNGGGQGKSEGSLGSKKHGKEEKVVEDKKIDAGGQGRFDQRSSEGSRALEGGMERNKQASKEKSVEVEAGMHRGKEEEDEKLIGEVAIKEKGTDAKAQERSKPEMKEREERSSEVNDMLGSKQPEKDLDEKLGFEKEEIRKQEDPRKNKPDEEGEDRERKIEKDVESKSVRDQKKINDEGPLPSYGDDLQKSLLQRMEDEQVEKHGKYMVNIGIAALVLMGFGAYLFLPFLKLFS